jgi:hypothetical protein
MRRSQRALILAGFGFICTLLGGVAYFKFKHYEMVDIDFSRHVMAGRAIHIHGHIATVSDDIFSLTDSKCVGGHFLLIEKHIVDWSDPMEKFLEDVKYESEAKKREQIIEVENYKVIKKDSPHSKDISHRCFEAY